MLAALAVVMVLAQQPETIDCLWGDPDVVVHPSVQCYEVKPGGDFDNAALDGRDIGVPDINILLAVEYCAVNGDLSDPVCVWLAGIPTPPNTPTGLRVL